MFGYLRPLVPELKVCEYHRYQANYCGLCRAISLQNGQAPRLALTYDVALLSLLLSDLAAEPEDIRSRRCVVRPLRPRKVREPGRTARYCADMGTFLSQRRALDGWKDERSAKAGAAALGLHAAARRAAGRLMQPARQVDESLQKLHRLEDEGCDQMDYPAEVFGELMETVAGSCPGLPENSRVPLLWMARQMGRWLYLVDAIDDMDRDAASGSYNPLLLFGGGKDEAVRLAAEACRWAAGQTAAAMDLLPLSYSRAVMENVVYAGMPAGLDKVMKEGTRSDG